jgi:hypothetical protein
MYVGVWVSGFVGMWVCGVGVWLCVCVCVCCMYIVCMYTYVCINKLVIAGSATALAGDKLLCRLLELMCVCVCVCIHLSLSRPLLFSLLLLFPPSLPPSRTLLTPNPLSRTQSILYGRRCGDATHWYVCRLAQKETASLRGPTL